MYQNPTRWANLCTYLSLMFLFWRTGQNTQMYSGGRLKKTSKSQDPKHSKNFSRLSGRTFPSKSRESMISLDIVMFLTNKPWCTSNWISDHEAWIDEICLHNFVLKMCGPIIKNEHLWVCKSDCNTYMSKYLFLYPFPCPH